MSTWKVVCDDHTSHHLSRAEAEAHIASVTRSGRCTLPHTVVPPVRRVTAIAGRALPDWWVGAVVERETATRYHLLRHAHGGRKPSRRIVRKEAVTVD